MKYRCRWCRHEWFPYVPDPVQCPRCKRAGWRDPRDAAPREAVICTRCGHKWMPRTITPAECPRCTNGYWNRAVMKPELSARLKSGMLGWKKVAAERKAAGGGKGKQPCDERTEGDMFTPRNETQTHAQKTLYRNPEMPRQIKRWESEGTKRKTTCAKRMLSLMFCL